MNGMLVRWAIALCLACRVSTASHADKQQTKGILKTPTGQAVSDEAMRGVARQAMNRTRSSSRSSTGPRVTRAVTRHSSEDPPQQEKNDEPADTTAMMDPSTATTLQMAHRNATAVVGPSTATTLQTADRRRLTLLQCAWRNSRPAVILGLHMYAFAEFPLNPVAWIVMLVLDFIAIQLGRWVDPNALSRELSTPVYQYACYAFVASSTLNLIASFLERVVTVIRTYLPSPLAPLETAILIAFVAYSLA